MRALTSIAGVWHGGTKASVVRARVVEKASPCANKNGEDADIAHKRKPRLQVELVCQAETNAPDPFWDAPRLIPAFVTQVLGQMMDQEQHRLVRTPYGAATAQAAALLDRKL